MFDEFEYNHSEVLGISAGHWRKHGHIGNVGCLFYLGPRSQDIHEQQIIN